MALFISEQVAAVTAYNAGNPQFTVYYGENAAEAARQALLAQGYAVDAATSAAYAGGFQTPEYATRAAGEAATTVGQVFRVPLNTSPQTFAWYRRAAIDSEEVSPIGAVDSGYLVKGNGLTTPVSASIIYDSGTNIGIGTSSPQAKVHARVTTDVNMWISNNGAELRTIAINDGMSAYINWRRDANQHAFETSGAERLRITSTGNVGIGTSAPNAKLDVVGNVNIGATLATGTGVSTGDVQLELGANRTGNGNTYIDWHATAGTDFESRIIRYGGANGGMDIINLGTGGMVLSQEGAAPMVFKTSAVERVRVKSGGQVRFVPLASAPSGAEAGDVYYDSGTNKLRCYNGTTWNDLF